MTTAIKEFVNSLNAKQLLSAKEAFASFTGETGDDKAYLEFAHTMSREQMAKFNAIRIKLAAFGDAPMISYFNDCVDEAQDKKVREELPELKDVAHKLQHALKDSTVHEHAGHSGHVKAKHAQVG